MGGSAPASPPPPLAGGLCLPPLAPRGLGGGQGSPCAGARAAPSPQDAPGQPGPAQCLLHCAGGCSPTLLCSALPRSPAHVEGSRSPPRRAAGHFNPPSSTCAGRVRGTQGLGGCCAPQQAAGAHLSLVGRLSPGAQHGICARDRPTWGTAPASPSSSLPRASRAPRTAPGAIRQLAGPPSLCPVPAGRWQRLSRELSPS